MNIKQLKKAIDGYDENREVVFHIWTGTKSKFNSLSISCNPKANTKNLFVLIENPHYEEPER